MDTGLRGIPVGTCQTSYVDPLEGVHYVGYPVADLVDLEEEDVIYLLLHKELPTPEQSEKFRAELIHRAESLPTGALRVLESLTPGARHGLLHSLERIREMHSMANPEMTQDVNKCKECGEITSREVCQSCTMRTWLSEAS